LAGGLIQKLITGQMIIRNRLYLFLFGASGFLLIVPIILVILEMVHGNMFSWDEGIVFMIMGLIGLIVLINFTKNLIRFVIK